MANESSADPSQGDPAILMPPPGVEDTRARARERSLLAYMKDSPPTDDPYSEMASLMLNVEDSYGNSQVVTAKVVQRGRRFRFSISCVLIVRFDPPVFGLPNEALLKLYDHRHCGGRSIYGLSPYSSSAKRAFATQVFHGDAWATALRIGRELGQCTTWMDPSSFQRLKIRYFVNEIPEGRKPQVLEVCCWKLMNEMHANEVKAYRLLEELQGADVPRFLGKVTLMGSCPACVPEEFKSFFQVEGILLEYIDGHDLNAALKDRWLTSKEYTRFKRTTEGIIKEIQDHGVEVGYFNPMNVILKDILGLEAQAHYHRPVVTDFSRATFPEPTATESSETDSEEQRELDEIEELYA